MTSSMSKKFHDIKVRHQMCQRDKVQIAIISKRFNGIKVRYQVCQRGSMTSRSDIKYVTEGP